MKKNVFYLISLLCVMSCNSDTFHLIGKIQIPNTQNSVEILTINNKTNPATYVQIRKVKADKSFNIWGEFDKETIFCGFLYDETNKIGVKLRYRPKTRFEKDTIVYIKN